MKQIVITGGAPLQGTVRVSGSKNAALAIMASVVLCEEPVTLHNVPRIGDIYTMVELLQGLGAEVEWASDSTLRIDSSGVARLEAPYELVRKMRASFCVMGPLLARFGRARVPVPGGCDIGARPVDFHLEGLRELGASIEVEHGVYTASADRLHGANIYFNFPSAGATQHLMTTACLAEGTTFIENGACEPEVVDLANFLNSLGAQIEGAGTPMVTVRGVGRLSGGDYTVIADRLEAGTFAVATAITRGDITLCGAVRDHMRPVLTKLMQVGVEVVEGPDGMRVWCTERVKPTDISTSPHPAFPTDMQSPFCAMLSTADGTSVITEKVYEARFRYVNELKRMGADIKVQGATAVVTGVERLTGARVRSEDLRGGAALVCAALGADGETVIDNVENVERGYQCLPAKLCALGATVSVREEAETGGKS